MAPEQIREALPSNNGFATALIQCYVAFLPPKNQVSTK